jgi:23S rRNA-/tRNA-specific pseudouridylate synthase
MSESEPHFSKDQSIGFPPPLLGREGLRVPVIAWGEGFVVLMKPSDCVGYAHPRFIRFPSMLESLRFQLKEEKPELLRLGWTVDTPLNAVYNLEPGISGMFIITTHPERHQILSNAWGSDGFRMIFHFLAKDSGGDSIRECSLPIAEDAQKGEVKVTHRHGKKTHTLFRRLKRWGNFALWEAETTYYRLDQLFLHAVESGLPVVGDRRYSRVSPILLSKLKKHYRGDLELERPIYPDPCVHLCRISVASKELGLPAQIDAEMPRAFRGLLNKLEEFAR